MEKRGTGLFLDKKGQITIFIILGIVILISVIAFFVIRSALIEERLPEIPVIAEVPSEFAPIRIFTEACIETTAEEAVRKIGQQGGYINPLEFGIQTSSIEPTESDGIVFSSGSELFIPYWLYLRAPNDCARNCLFSSQRPELKKTTGLASDNAIEAQIERYVDENLKTCLRDFEDFRQQGYVIEEQGDIKTTAIIGENDIGIYVEYPLSVSVEGSEGEISQYYTFLPVNLKQVYELATQIANAEANNTFLEMQSLNLITQFANTDTESLPPKTELTFNYGAGMMWSVPAVKKDIEEMLMTYVPALQVPFTLNYERRSFPGNPLRESVYAMEIPANLDRRFSDLAVRFDYLGWWPIYFNAGDGSVIRPESVSALFLPLGLQRYSTTYDISYPVVITITDPDAFGGAGYDFMFALEANIRNNEPIDETFRGLEGIYIFEPSLLCNENQKNSGEVRVAAKDGRSNKPLDNVQIAFTCGEETCFIGETSTDGLFISKFPICHNGILSYLKEDYFASSEYITTGMGEEKFAAATLYPYIEKPVDVVKLLYMNNQLSVNELSLDADEKAVVLLTRIKETPGDEDVIAAAEVTDEATLRLVPGEYSVSITIVKMDSLVIPAETRKVDAGILGLFVDEEYTIPGVSLEDSYVSGGVEINEDNGVLLITPSMLYDDSKLVLKAIGFPTPKTVEDTVHMGNIEEYSSRFRNMLEPGYTE